MSGNLARPRRPGSQRKRRSLHVNSTSFPSRTSRARPSPTHQTHPFHHMPLVPRGILHHATSHHPARHRAPHLYRHPPGARLSRHRPTRPTASSTSLQRLSSSATTQTWAPILYISMAPSRHMHQSSNTPSRCTTRSPQRRPRRQRAASSAECLARLALTPAAKLAINSIRYFTVLSTTLSLTDLTTFLVSMT